jgi:hypothetical protein
MSLMRPVGYVLGLALLVAPAVAAQQRPMTMLPVPPLPQIGLPLPHIGLPPPSSELATKSSGRTIGPDRRSPDDHRGRGGWRAPVIVAPIYLIAPAAGVPNTDAPGHSAQQSRDQRAETGTVDQKLDTAPRVDADYNDASASTIEQEPSPALRPPGPTTLYVIPGCYAGNVPPAVGALPTGCDAARLTTIHR